MITLACISPFVFAQAQESFAQDIRGYDIESLMWAVVMSLLGGALRTIFTLATDDHVVGSFGKETFKDGAVAMVAGALAYIVLEAFISAKVFVIPSEIRFAFIVFAGWSRLSFFGWLNRLGTRVADSVTEHAVTAIAVKTGIPPKTVPPVIPKMADLPQPAPKPKPFQEVK